VIARRTIGFSMRNWIIWHYTFGQQTKKKFARSHTHIFYFTKGDDAKQITFNADAVRVASARQTVYADSRANAKGKLPDDTWFLRPQVAEAEAGYFPPVGDTWNFSRLCGTFNEREGWHGCQMPIAVLDRILKASSNRGDVVLDPFNGSGTTCVSAALLGRKFVGIDQSEEYVAYARKRIEYVLQIHNGTNDVTNGHVFAKTRQSKVKTQTDAFGRPRVERKKRAPAVRRAS
jgi:site-specific DNA-methyltransferase (adenine-specific)